MRRTIPLILILSVLLVVTCITLNSVGLAGLADEFGGPISKEALFDLVVRLFSGTGITLITLIYFLILYRLGRPFPIPALLFALIGVISIILLMNYAHDFGHVVFDECSSTYGDLILILCAPITLNVTLATILSRKFPAAT
ncbi:hypothetical protein [Haloferula sp.]|uniref:hypothetical protein n=1 Tax=Haloferula sp. TaxID=2497595 RepID=UPI00329E8F36